ncbi:iron ABC transporter substrate-binding protein [Mesorhizobium loti]|nr:ABC transporter substrate-binding protein [Mesorhizobium loti]PLP57548.1 iron ABC transporter substrate-binding protein [Mesorhizobium loti]
MKYVFWGGLALVSAVFLPQLATAEPDIDRMSVEELLPLAQNEGRVTVYSFTSRIARVEKEFEKTYPGVDLIPSDMSSTEQIARLKTEAAAGISNADVVYLSDTPVVLTELLEKGLIQNYVPPRVEDRMPNEFKVPLLAPRLSTKVLMYSKEAYPDGSPIKNLWQLTAKEWKGRVVMVDPLQRGDYLDLMTEFVLRSDEMAKAYQTQFGKPIELDEGVDSVGAQFIVDLFENDVVIVGSSDDVSAAIGRKGQKAPPVGFTTYSDMRDNEREGWALQVANDVEPSNGIIFPAVLAITTKTAHPAAARLAIDFLMGDDSKNGGPSYAPFYVPGDYAARTDIESHPDAVPLKDLVSWRVDPAATAKLRQSIGDLILLLQ